MKRVCISTALNSQFHAVVMFNLLSHMDTNLIHIHTHQLTKPTHTSQTTDTHQNHIRQIPPTTLNLHIILNLRINLNLDLNTDTPPLLPTTPPLLPIIPPPLPTTHLRHPTEKNNLLIKPLKKNSSPIKDRIMSSVLTHMLSSVSITSCIRHIMPHQAFYFQYSSTHNVAHLCCLDRNKKKLIINIILT